jgi:hypothetical protein
VAYPNFEEKNLTAKMPSSPRKEREEERGEEEEIIK